MADISNRRRISPPNKDDSGLSQRDQDLARVEALLRDEFSPPLDDDAGPTVAPEPVRPEEAVEIARLPRLAKLPVRRPKVAGPVALTPVSEPPAARPKSSPVHIFLQILILLFVLAWVFILGIMVGRGHLGESGPIHGLVVWLEEKAGWTEPEEPPVVYVQEPAVEPDEGLDWEDVRRRPGYSAGLAAGAWAASKSPPAVAPPEKTGTDSSAAESENQDQSAEDVSGDMNSQQLSATSSLVNYDDPAAGPKERGDLQLTEDRDEDAEAATGDDEPITLATTGVDGLTPHAATGDDELTPTAAIENDESTSPDATRLDSPQFQQTDPAEAGAALEASGAADGKYAVQVASPHDEADAQQRVEKLRSQGLPAYYYQTSAGRYPVRVGRFATRAEAGEAKDRLDSLGYKGLYVSTLTD